MEKYLSIIEKFVKEMGYENNQHFLGIYYYGSTFNGFENKNSDIDLHIVFDDSDLTHIYRGVHYIDNIKIEYFEKCISDLYLSVDNDLKDCNLAWHSMIVNSKILYEKNDGLQKLREYTKEKYKNDLPKFDEQDIMEYISIINNRMEKLKIAYENDEENFYHLYQITIEKIRRFYHSINGFPKINTTKIYKVYKNDEYRKSYYNGKFVSEEFKKMYFDLVEDTTTDKKQLLQKLENFYKYVKNGRELPKGNFKIKIKSRNNK